MFPSPLRIFNQPETRTASPSQPISIRQPNPINFPSPNKHVLSRCTRRIEQGGRHENRQPFGSRFELRDISRMRYTGDTPPPPPLRRAEQDEGGDDRARAAFSCGGGKSSRSQRRDRIAVDVPPPPRNYPYCLCHTLPCRHIDRCAPHQSGLPPSSPNIPTSLRSVAASFRGSFCLDAFQGSSGLWWNSWEKGMIWTNFLLKFSSPPPWIA